VGSMRRPREVPGPRSGTSISAPAVPGNAARLAPTSPAHAVVEERSSTSFLFAPPYAAVCRRQAWWIWQRTIDGDEYHPASPKTNSETTTPLMDPVPLWSLAQKPPAPAGRHLQVLLSIRKWGLIAVLAVRLCSCRQPNDFSQGNSWCPVLNHPEVRYHGA
jgi:hypothetical protein